jgi:diacylglycerol kinase (ATP)
MAMAKQLKKQLVAAMPKVSVRCIPTEHAGHAIEIAETIAREERIPLIVSSSGDGGYNEVINGVINSGNKQAVCMVLPAGNANDHSRTMQSKPVLELITKAKVTRLDLLGVTITDNSGQSIKQYAHSYIGLGLTPTVATELNKHTLNAFREIVLLIQTFYKYRPFKIRYRGKVVQLDSLIFANINQMAKVLTLAPENKPQDGKFEVVLFRAHSKWATLKKLVRSAAATLPATNSVSSYKFSAITKLPMQLDGEVTVVSAGSTITVVSEHKALRTIF